MLLDVCALREQPPHLLGPSVVRRGPQLGEAHLAAKIRPSSEPHLEA
eukprot:CAMPEP_0180165790 /NCGR_PEP_ID=MMETSP0986-20121125/31176_1 /TAXON_ID=697907 /ORGANISM="non described non described, Strain CCMP2293" /LENGTH=46 /DNA_ID= /DNA_START= /DNA_END= /DNA_ORIENTATION=